MGSTSTSMKLTSLEDPAEPCASEAKGPAIKKCNFEVLIKRKKNFYYDLGQH